jgi:hypothetical protein
MTKWVDTSETLPPYNVRVLVVVEGEPLRIEVSSFGITGGHFLWAGLDGLSVTHWAELPSFPAPGGVNLDLPISDKKQVQLFDHLRMKFDDAYAWFCVGSLAYDIEAFGQGYSEPDSTYLDYQYAEDDATKAYQLYRTCKGSPSLDKYSACCWALSCDLKSIALNTYQVILKKRGRGRPGTTKLRNALIARIYGHYPMREKGHKTEGSHFEQTVQIILKWIEPSPPEDVHSAIIRALGAKED